MATTTTNAGFPKPSGTDPFQPDVDIANLADSVDSFIYSKFPDAITKTYSIPLLFATRALMLAETGRFTGQKAVVNADSNSVYNGDYKWSGTAWVRDSRWLAATKSALPTGATITPQIVAGTEGAKATVTSDSTAANNGDYVWSGSAWTPVRYPPVKLSNTTGEGVGLPIVIYSDTFVASVGANGILPKHFYKTPFPTAVVSLVICNGDSIAVPDMVVGVRESSVDGFIAKTNTPSGAARINYIAVGY